MSRSVWMFGLLMACGGELSPPGKCNQLIDVVCDRTYQCILDTDHAQCVKDIRSFLSCGSVTMVSSTYDRCIELLETRTCRELFPVNWQTGEPTLELPVECERVLLKDHEEPADAPLHGPLSTAVQAEARSH